MILDTSFIIDVLRKKEYALEILKKIEEIAILKISSITVFELMQFLGKDDAKEILGTLRTIPVTEDIAYLGGKIRAQLRKQGKDIDKMDCLIAATALTENEQILTLNTKHFSRIQSIKLLDV